MIATMDGPQTEELCDRLRKTRKRRILTLQELSDMSGVHWTTISCAETNREYQPHPSTLRKLAAELDIEPAQLYERPNLEGRK